MVEISCYYNHYNRAPILLVFIKYNNFMKIKIDNNKPIILDLNTFMEIPLLFEFYILSLLCTKNYTDITYDNNEHTYKIQSIKYWKHLYFNNHYDMISIYYKRNPLNMQEPKRQTSSKKINKFVFQFRNLLLKNPIDLINQFILSACYDTLVIVDNYERFKRYNKYNEDIKLLTAIKSNYGTDIYSHIVKFM